MTLQESFSLEESMDSKTLRVREELKILSLNFRLRLMKISCRLKFLFPLNKALVRNQNLSRFIVLEKFLISIIPFVVFWRMKVASLQKSRISSLYQKVLYLPILSPFSKQVLIVILRFKLSMKGMRVQSNASQTLWRKKISFPRPCQYKSKPPFSRFQAIKCPRGLKWDMKPYQHGVR